MYGRAGVVLLLCFILIVCSVRCNLRTDQKFWIELAERELDDALNVRWNLDKAKNVILFVGDGMGPNTVTAARIYKGGESSLLSFEKFPHVGILKTYSANKMVPDSSCTATALFTGVKVNQETIGVDATVQKGDCPQSLVASTRLKSLVAVAQEAGKSTGVVTTMRVTHATPSPMFAHSADRTWECAAQLQGVHTCKDIATQLVEDQPGRDINVILGGGMQVLVSNVSGSPQDPIDTWSCRRQDGRNLLEEYKRDKEVRGLKYSIVKNNQQLKDFNVEETDHLFGIFANSHLPYEHERDDGPGGTPALADMVEAAIKVLEKNTKGYFLMVEGGNIDMAHHRGKAKKAVSEAVGFHEAVATALRLTDQLDTLVVVTSDHTHTLTINGYPLRGSNIFGAPQASNLDGINYTTLSYGTGGPLWFQYHVQQGSDAAPVVVRDDPSTTDTASNLDGINYTTLSYGTGGPLSFQYHVQQGSDAAPVVVRDDPSTTDTDSFEYEQIASIKLRENAHGGGDVIIYANGPHSHLFHTVHEQHYVFHAISYAANLGKYRNSCPPPAATYAALPLAILAAACHAYGNL